MPRPGWVQILQEALTLFSLGGRKVKTEEPQSSGSQGLSKCKVCLLQQHASS